MGRNIKKLEFKILLFVLTFLFSLACFAGNKQIIAGPNSGIDFMTNGENTRMSIDSTGDISASGDFTMLNGSIFGATFDGTSLSLADSVLGNKVTFLAEDSTANYSIVLPAANCSSGEVWQWDGSEKPQCTALAGGVGGSGTAEQFAFWDSSNTLSSSPDIYIENNEIFATNDANFGGAVSYHRGGSYAAKRTVKFYDAKSSSISCGGAISGIQTRALSFALPSDDDWFDFDDANDKFIVEPGVYYFSFSYPAYEVDRHKAWLRFDVDGSPYTLEHCVGNNSSVDQAPVTVTHSGTECVVEFAASTDIDVQHFTQTAKATFGLGVPSNTTQSEICGWVYVEKWR